VVALAEVYSRELVPNVELDRNGPHFACRVEGLLKSVARLVESPLVNIDDGDVMQNQCLRRLDPSARADSKISTSSPRAASYRPSAVSARARSRRIARSYRPTGKRPRLRSVLGARPKLVLPTRLPTSSIPMYLEPAENLKTGHIQDLH
jgi:hypothetical protein